MGVITIGPGLECDLDLLVASRLLVQASSGQGKTRTIRRLLEQFHGQVQQLVIDPEGEYHTLREVGDYVLAAPTGGDVTAEPRHAKRLARELLKLGASAILDIYELSPEDRRAFVAEFLTGLVDAPRDLWHPCLIVLDEAHVFCPEGGKTESSKAVEALASKGRKRGFCLIAATQRLSKFKKDAAAELGNKLIGGCNLDVDIDRAGDELGLARSERARVLRGMQPGMFYAFGRAFLVKEPTLVKVGPVKSRHPEPGEAQSVEATPTPKAIKAILGALAEIPAEVEREERRVEDLETENNALRASLTRLELERLELERFLEQARKPERVEVPIMVLSQEAVQVL
jgi:DNA helicase HerA-like ATPase